MGLGKGVSGWAWWLARIDWWLLTLALANIFSYNINVVDGLERLKSAVSDFEAEADFDFVDPKQLAAVIDRLQGALCKVLDRGRERGDHRLAGLSPASWAARTCGLSRKAAADRLCVGRQLGSLPETAAALAGGAISYQAASALCHLREQLGERWQPANEAEMVGFAHTFSIEDLHICCRHARHVADPDGFDTDSKEDFERRWLQVSPMLDGMHSVDGVLDPVTGAAFRTALDALAGWRGPGDTRNQSQRMADALAELLDHPMNEGLLPRRKGVRPHLSLTTTLPGLKRELGGAGGGAGAGDADLRHHRGAAGLRLHDVAGADGGLGRGRRRPRHPHRPAGDPAGAPAARSGLPLAGLRPAGQLVDSPPS